MGSLPNLDHVYQEQLERREKEKERELARERAREREFCHDKDSWRERALSLQTRQYQRPFLPQRRVVRTRSSGNTNHLTEEPMLAQLSFLASATAASSASAAAAAANAPKSHRIVPQQQPNSLPISITQHVNVVGGGGHVPAASASALAVGGHHHHPVLSAASSTNPSSSHHAPHPHHYHHHNLIQPQSSNPLSNSANRRRESANSSIGATSVRRLLTVNRGCHNKIPVHVRAKVVKNFIILVIGHSLISATLLPMIGLQGSNSIWTGERQSYEPILDFVEEENPILTETPANFGPPIGIGSILLSLSFLLTSGMCFLTTVLLRRLGHYLTILSGYVGVALFLGCHFISSYYTLLPGYVILGLVLGPLGIAKLNLVIVMANKLSCGQHECCNAITTPTTMAVNPSATIDHDEQQHILFAASKPACSRDENIRRLARWYHAGQDFGIICGAVIASLLLTCAAFYTPAALSGAPCTNTSQRGGIMEGSGSSSFSYSGNERMLQLSQIPDAKKLINVTNSFGQSMPSRLADNGKMSIKDKNRTRAAASPSVSASTEESLAEPLLTLGSDSLSENYDTNSHGERICGAASCPVWMHASHAFPIRFVERKYAIPPNASDSKEDGFPERSVSMRFHAIVAVYLVLSLVAIGSTMWTAKFTGKKNLSHPASRYHSIPGLADTMIFSGPLAYFIGTEQGYILADFMKAYVSCSLGPHMVAGALIGLGIMQLVASCTLSMLLRHTKRIVVIIAGLFFHACLLLVLSRWKPSKDDSALFYVIAAAWGVCNAVWSTMLFTIVSLTHKNHMVEVLSPLHGIKYLAMGITFGAHGFICEYPKIIVLAILLVVSVPPYASLEIKLEAQRKATSQNKANSILQIPTL